MSRIIGYTAGVFDLFHVGHLNVLKKSKSLCDKLIVGCTVDELVVKNKRKTPVIPFNERVEILESIKYVDLVVAQEENTYSDKYKAWEMYKFNMIFVGSDWKGSKKWTDLEEKLSKVNVKVIYFPYTSSTSSTIIQNILKEY